MKEVAAAAGVLLSVLTACPTAFIATVAESCPLLSRTVEMTPSQVCLQLLASEPRVVSDLALC